jgi:predicted aldo/keto reductase-like oxidoreductase
MHQVTLGKTGLRVVRLGLGGIPIQQVSEKQAVETVVHSLRRGIDFIDTARGYTNSERRIGLALRETGGGRRIVLASKSRRRSADGIRQDIDTSLKELQRDGIDLYQCHFVKDRQDYRKIISSGGALQGLLKARSEGLIAYIGVTTHSLDLVEHMLADDIFETVMVCFSFLEPAAAERVFPAARRKNWGIIAMKPFSGGVLDNAATALKFVFSHPDILVIPGVESPQRFEENWRVFGGTWDLSATETAQIEHIRDRYDKNFCRRCDYCQPCSEDIPIQVILGLRYAVKRFGTGFLGQGWVKTAIEKARNCSACGECLERCPYNLPIPDLIAENLHWLDEHLR